MNRQCGGPSRDGLPREGKRDATVSKLSHEEERQLIAEVEALRDDPDAPLDMVPLQPAQDPRAVLSVELPFETIGRLQTLADAHGLSLGEVITRVLDSFEASTVSEEEASEASPPPRRRRRSAKAS
jgi:hypothetical protein